MGIREKKRTKTEAAILESAEKLMIKNGFSGASVEEIAERAEVAVGTVYNYFGSKSGLLLAIAERDTKAVLAAGEHILGEPPEDPVRGIGDLISTYAQEILRLYDRRLLREMFIAGFQEVEPLGKKFVRLDFELMGQISRLLKTYQEGLSLRRDLPLDGAALVLYGSFSMAIMMSIMDERVTPETVKESVRSAVRLIFMGWKAQVGNA